MELEDDDVVQALLADSNKVVVGEKSIMEDNLSNTVRAESTNYLNMSYQDYHIETLEKKKEVSTNKNIFSSPKTDIPLKREEEKGSLGIMTPKPRDQTLMKASFPPKIDSSPPHHSLEEIPRLKVGEADINIQCKFNKMNTLLECSIFTDLIDKSIRKKSKLLNLLEQLNNEDDRPKRLLDIFANCNIRNRVVKFSLVPNDFKPAWLNPLRKKEKLKNSEKRKNLESLEEEDVDTTKYKLMVSLSFFWMMDYSKSKEDLGKLPRSVTNHIIKSFTEITRLLRGITISDESMEEAGEFFTPNRLAELMS